MIAIKVETPDAMDALPSSDTYDPSNPAMLDLRRAQSLCFAILTTMQLFQSFLSKSVTLSVFKTGITNNPSMIYAFLVSFLLMLLGIYVPGMNLLLNFYGN